MTRAALAWLAALVAGRAAFAALQSAPGPVSGYLVSWLLAAVVAVVVWWGLARTLSDDLVATSLAGFGWGAASAAGWYFDVALGGPLSGIATTLALAGERRSTSRRLGGLMLATLGGLALLRVLQPQAMPGRWALAAAVALVAAPAGALAAGLGVQRAILMALSWGAAWVGAFWLSGALPALQGSTYGPATVEVILAFVLGGLATRHLLGVGSVNRWIVAATIAGVGGVLLDLLLRASSSAVAQGGASRLSWAHAVSMAAAGQVAASGAWRGQRSTPGA